MSKRSFQYGFLFCCFLCIFMLSFVLVALAAPDDSSSPELVDVEASSDPVVEDPALGDDELILTNVAVLTSVAPVTPDSTSGLKAVLLSFLGDYDPVIVEYEYQNPNSQYVSYLREVEPDYVWLCSAALLVVIIFCLFRLGGAILCRK